jgi:hypothetical protein
MFEPGPSKCQHLLIKLVASSPSAAEGGEGDFTR